MMMKRNFYLLVVLLLAFGNFVFAGNRSTAEMLQIAENQLSSTMAKGKLTSRQMRVMATTSSLKMATAVTGQNDYIYVYGYDNGGFVLVSGDDAFVPVLAYSESASFDSANLPENVRSWIEGYVREMKAYQSGQLRITSTTTTTTATAKTTSSSLPSSVAPFMTALWSQDAPYNAQCPKVTDGVNTYATVTGCVATAMAQVMYYYKYPTTGIGSNSFKYILNLNNYPDTVSYSVDFSKTAYDWTNMIDDYASTSYTQAQADAVATLMYHAGASVNMVYSPNSSSASDLTAFFALQENFGYDDAMRYYTRDYMSDADWISILKTESAAGRPVLYSGNGTGGHEFIVNGYNSSDQFYINWGWGGYCNGYYSISSLKPASNGKLEGNDFSYSNTIITGIQKPDGITETHLPVLRSIGSADIYNTADVTTVKSGDKETLPQMLIANYSSVDFSGVVGFFITDDNGNLITSGQLTGSRADYIPGELDRNGSDSYSIMDNASFVYPTLAYGKYKLYLGYKIDGETDWRKIEILRTLSQCYYLTYSGGTIARSVKGYIEPATSIDEISDLPANTVISWVTPDGKLVYSGTDTSLHLAPGVYLVRVGDKTKRVVVTH